MRALSRFAVLIVGVSVCTTACSAGSSGGAVHPAPAASPSAVGALGAGFYDPQSPPPPEGTLTPRPGSYAHVHPPAGYRVVLLTAGSDRPTRTVATAVRAWAAQEHVALTTVTASTADPVPGIVTAMKRPPDLVISVGDALVDPLATVTASALQQQFLVVGAELAEPTQNVTAAEWPGAGFRGEGLGQSTAYDAATFTPARVGRAVRAGVAAVLNHVTGIVVSVD